MKFDFNKCKIMDTEVIGLVLFPGSLMSYGLQVFPLKSSEVLISLCSWTEGPVRFTHHYLYKLYTVCISTVCSYSVKFNLKYMEYASSQLW
jgi:hypothetical protein